MPIQRPKITDSILLLMKAYGEQPPIVTVTTTMLDMLANYAESMGRSKMTPGEPNLRDLGLLRDKVCYSQPEAKAEKRIKNEDGSRPNKDGDNDMMIPIPNLPHGTAMGEEYLAVSLAQKALSVFFSRDETCKKLNAEESNINPIGFCLAHHRALKAEREQEASLDYAT
jgi:hypothetical protein